MAVADTNPDTNPVTRHRFTVIDVETSGLNPRRHRVLQIALIGCLGNGTVTDEWSSFVRPPWPRRVGPTRVHGITRRTLQRAPAFPVVAPELARRLDATTLVGHNVDFDWSFLEQEHRRAGIALAPTARLCTLELSRASDPGRLMRHRLGDVAGRAGVTVGRPHDALADARATAAALPYLLAEVGVSTVEDLIPFVSAQAAPGAL